MSHQNHPPIILKTTLQFHECISKHSAPRPRPDNFPYFRLLHEKLRQILVKHGFGGTYQHFFKHFGEFIWRKLLDSFDLLLQFLIENWFFLCALQSFLHLVAIDIFIFPLFRLLSHRRDAIELKNNQTFHSLSQLSQKETCLLQREVIYE